uniref:Coiled-coil domain containing 34 n=1 Tax=Nothobranchius rachovii TaxID=451742 RepID=A0A1A8NR60_9TELE
MPKCPASACKGFSSTPVKTRQRADFQVSEGLDDGVLSDDEDTFSLLSPIYHDSFDSDEEELGSTQASPRHDKYSRQCTSPARSELPKTPSERMSSPAVHPAVSPSHSAWEVWLLNKTKEDRLKMEKKVEEESLLKEKQEMQQRERELKKTIAEEKILGWLKVKREQERQEQLQKQKKEKEEMQRQQEKQRDINQKAQQKYKDWLQKKNQERAEKEKKEKEEASIKEKLERERQRSAEEKFKEWLTQAKEKSRASPALPSYPTSPYDKSYPAPSFYNPIPWKPIHVPPPETSPNKTSGKKPPKQKRTQQSSCSAIRLRNTHSLQKR